MHIAARLALQIRDPVDTIKLLLSPEEIAATTSNQAEANCNLVDADMGAGLKFHLCNLY